ncbi:MAG: hypothetical protein ACK5LY_04345 [Lachnospirales bacterium]
MVEGNYIAKGKVMGSEMESHIEYLVEGATLTGKMVVMGNTVDVEKGNVDGDSFTHLCHVPTPMGKMKVKVAGSINGDDISFILQSPMAKSEFVGKRI